MHSIDLSKFKLRTDLALDNVSTNFSKENIKIYNEDNVKITEVYINSSYSKEINKKVGNYVTLEFDDITDCSNKDKIEKSLYNCLKKFININNDELVLIVGLGNKYTKKAGTYSPNKQPTYNIQMNAYNPNWLL